MVIRGCSVRVEVNCSGCVAAVLVLTLEPKEGEAIGRCQARQTRAAGWDFNQAGHPRCPDCRGKAPDAGADTDATAHQVPAAMAAAVPGTTPRKRRK